MKRLLALVVLTSAVLGTYSLLRASIASVPSNTWAAAGDMSSIRAGASGTLLPDGLVLIAGGMDEAGVTASAERYNADGGSFLSTPPMQVARANHTATLLADGRVLVAGGAGVGGPAVAVSEIYDPSVNAWLPAGSLNLARRGHTATLLPDGKVLVAGGDDGGTATDTLEVFDPDTSVFTPVSGVLGAARTLHAAARLADGRVLIAGGYDGAAPLASTSVYDAETGTVSAGPDLSTPRSGLSATVLLDGKVLVAGGVNTTGELATGEVFDPTSNTFAATDSALGFARQTHLAFLLPHNNQVLIVGGTASGSAVAAAELYTPWEGMNGTFCATPVCASGYAGPAAPGVARAWAAGSALSLPASATNRSGPADGLLLLAGGSGHSSAEVYGFATVKTDRDDYAPGETVTIFGSGWQPGESVALVLREAPLLDEHPLLDVTADESGNIVSTEFVPDEHDIGIRFYLTAYGTVSQALTTFTDGPKVGSVSVGAQAPIAVAPGFNATYTITVNRGTGPGSSGAFTANLSVTTPLPTGAAAPFSPTPVSFTPSQSSRTSTLTISTTGAPPASATPEGSTAFTVKAATSAADFATASGTLVVDATAPVVSAIVRAGTNPTNASSVSWNVTFSESVTGIDSGDFTLATSGVTGASITSVTGSGDTLTVTASTGTGDGTLGLNLVDDDTILDRAGNKLGGTGLGNGSFTGQVYDIDKTGPSVTVNQAGTQADPTNASPLNFTVIFNESVSDFATGDVTLGGSAGATTGVVTGSGTTYNVAVSGMTSDGTVVASVLAGKAHDALGNPNTASTSTDATVTYDTTPPVSSIMLGPASPNGSNGWYTVNVQVTVSATDGIGSGVAEIRCVLDPALPPANFDAIPSGCPYTGGGADLAAEGQHVVYAASRDHANNKESSVKSQTLKLDKTGPSAALAVTAGTPGTNGWYTSNVTVTSSGADSISAPVTCTPEQFQTTETTGAVFNGSCTNDAGLSTNAPPLTVKLDKTAPTDVALAVTAGTMGTNGWYTSDVTVTTTGTELVSAPVTCTADQVQSAETTGQAFSGSCTNAAGLSANAPALSVKLDKTGPSATLTVSAGTAGTNGWHTSNVTVDTDGEDMIAAPVTCTADQYQTTETMGSVFNGSCINDAGLSTDAAPLTVKLDKTAPTDVALAVTAGTLGANNWYISDVTVTTSGTETISTPISCSAPQNQTAETAGQAFNGSCTNAAGLSANAPDLTVKLDKTGPSATLAVTVGTPGTNGWHTSNVTVDTSGDDSIASPVNCTPDQFQTTETTGAVFNGSCTNDAGMSTSAAALTVKLDKTAPTDVALGVTAGTLGTNNWYTSDVTAHTSGSELVSVPVTCTADQVQSAETTGQALNGSCTNDAGLTANAPVLMVKLDKTGPSATLAVTVGTLGTNGWHTSNVTADTDGEDMIAAPVTCSADQYQTTETMGSVFNGSCTNDAGLSTSAAPLTVKLDKTGPSAALSASGTMGMNGWSIGDVTVSTAGSDSVSAPVTCTSNQFQTADTTGATFNGWCTNHAGLVTNAANLMVKRDTVPPTVNPAVAPNPVVLNGSATVSSGAADATSLVASQSCDALVTSGVGPKTVGCTATDNAGHMSTATADYSVIYALSTSMCLGSAGHQILQPINSNGSSVFKQKSTVPAKFRVCDANGVSVGAPGVVYGFYLVGMGAGTATEVNEPVESTTPDTAFRWSSTDQQWIFNINTKGLVANRSYWYLITLNDGSTIPFQYTLK